MKQCIACGMPMEKTTDYALNDSSKDYCKYCAREDGTMQSYEEKLRGLTSFIQKTQGLTKEVGESAAKAMMANLPAWNK